MNKFLFCVQTTDGTRYGALKAHDGAEARRILDLYLKSQSYEVVKLDLQGVMGEPFQFHVFDLKGKSMSTIETLFDDASTRKKETVMPKLEVMIDDMRNDDMGFWVQLDSWIEFGKTYKITIEEVPTHV